MKKIFGTLFLSVYFVILVSHLFYLSWNSIWVVLAVLLGFVLAVFAHLRHSIVTLGFLITHMSFEWFEYARHGWHFSREQFVVYGVHVVFDGVFLHQELKKHYNKFRWAVFTSVVGLLFVVFIINYRPPPRHFLVKQFQARGITHNHAHDSLLSAFVVGGMLGCVLSHCKRERFSKSFYM